MINRTELLKLKDGRTFPYRRVGKGDAGALRAFSCCLSKLTADLFMPHKYDDQTLAKVIERSEKDDDRVYVVCDGEKVIAYFFLWWYRTPFPVLGIGVDDDYHGLGLGKQLMQILLDDAVDAGCDGVELTTALTNKKAKSLYEKVGFRTLGVVDNYSGDGRLIREYHMVYPIKPDCKPPEREHKPPV